MVRDVVEAVSRLPSDFRRAGNRSIVDLAEESGYLSNPGSVTETELAQYLAAHSKLIEDWVNWSADKRTSRGWYLLKPFDQHNGPFWVVGYYPGRIEEQFSDAATACAKFVKLELEGLRSRRERA